jgi:hypothetical protein
MRGVVIARHGRRRNSVRRADAGTIGLITAERLVEAEL